MYMYMYMCIYIYIYIYIYRSCHILPFRPILRNKCFPPEPAKTAKHRPHLFQRGVDYGKYDY